MIAIFTPSFADESNTNAQNLTVKEIIARMAPSRFRVEMLGSNEVDPRIATRPNTKILRWQKRGNTLRILRHLLRNPPDVYFFPRESGLDAAFLWMRTKLELKTALVTYVVSGGLEQDRSRQFLRRAIREADVVAANSKQMSETVVRLGGSNVEIVYDGVDRRYYYPSQKQVDNTQRPRVLFAGSFRPYKRAEVVLREAAKYPDWEFRLAGVGEERNACELLAKELKCKNVAFLGHLNAAQLGEEMRNARIFFFPSVIEGNPQVLLQAGACGLPCVARDLYHSDYVVDGVTGLLVSSEGEMGAALNRLMIDPELSVRMSSAAIAHVQQFDLDRIAQQWQDIMERAVSRRCIQTSRCTLAT
jgi:glycosyltransferase involved in cell wall biosynthesis